MKILKFLALGAIVQLSFSSGVWAAETCPPGEHWDEGMQMCMPDEASPKSPAMVMFHLNQFLVYNKSQGPRGRSAFSGQDMWMLDITKETSRRNTLGLQWMGTADLWLLPHDGYPHLAQSGEVDENGKPFIDGQHPHTSPIMGLTFMDILKFGGNDQHKITFFFAPRGEATAGPEAFMHRESAQGNPDAPLSHHLQDAFHIASTVVGMKLETQQGTTVEVSGFSGIEPQPSKVNLDMHPIDSYALRVNQVLALGVKAGGSVARMKHGGTDLEYAYSAWLQTHTFVGSGELMTSSIWGMVDHVDEDTRLNSFLEEFVYTLGKNNFIGRLEVFQRTPDQLEITGVDSKGGKWIKTLTLGYERKVLTRSKMNLFAGGTVSKYVMPESFKPTYGGKSPAQAKAFLRFTFGNHHR